MAKFNTAVFLLGFLLISFMLIEAGDYNKNYFNKLFHKPINSKKLYILQCHFLKVKDTR